MQENTEKQQQFPTEEVTLPSKGLLYPKDSPLRSGKLEMKYMTAREEDILTNQNYINNGTVIDKLLQSLIVTPFNYNDLLIGDKNAVLIAARILGYGSDYEFTHGGENHKVDLTKIEDKELKSSLISNNNNEFNFTLPTSKIKITFKLLTHGDEKSINAELKGLKKIDKNASYELTTRLKHIITSINGEYEKPKVREFIDNRLLARDARSLRKEITKIQPDVNLKYKYEDNNGDLIEVPIPIGINFFWPDAGV